MTPGGAPGPDLFERVEAWIEDDDDPVTRDELTVLLRRAAEGDGDAHEDLEDRFLGLLRFGTAGLRGPLGAGPNRMNRPVVTRAAAGIARWITDTDPVNGPSRGVVVGFDARHRSADFAEVSARVLAGAGIRVMLLPEPLPTPVLAFAVRHLGTAAGIMVTASHNPPEDNGYKVYDGTGRQIVAPVDQHIASVLEGIERASEAPLADARDPRIETLDDRIVADYVTRAAAVGLVPTERCVTIAYTAMHGVGTAVFRRVLAAAGFAPAVEVASQIDPDPDFPTVAFPNPEEPGALDRGLAVAAEAGADLLLANDPDADRLGVAVPDPSRGDPTDPGAWRSLRGDEIGVILADHLLRHRSGSKPGDLVATTIVSSSLLAHIARAQGVGHRETLTGFKWLTRAADDGERLVYAYEEALGFAVAPDLVADKDGLTAAVLLAEAAAVQKAAGRSLLDVLDELARAHGLHRTAQWSARADGSDGMARLAGSMARLRIDPPSRLAGSPVEQVVDLATGATGLPPSDVLVLHLTGARIIVRPSGTEPKLKCYLEVVEPVDHAAGGLDGAGTRADARLDELTTAIATATGLA